MNVEKTRIAVAALALMALSIGTVHADGFPELSQAVQTSGLNQQIVAAQQNTLQAQAEALSAQADTQQNASVNASSEDQDVDGAGFHGGGGFHGGPHGGPGGGFHGGPGWHGGPGRGWGPHGWDFGRWGGRGWIGYRPGFAWGWYAPLGYYLWWGWPHAGVCVNYGMYQNCTNDCVQQNNYCQQTCGGNQECYDSCNGAFSSCTSGCSYSYGTYPHC